MIMISSGRVFLSPISRASCHRCRDEPTILGNHATSLNHYSSLTLFPVYSSTDFYHRGCLAISSQHQISPGFYPEKQCLSFHFVHPISILGLEWWLRVSHPQSLHLDVALDFFFYRRAFHRFLLLCVGWA